MTSYVRSSVLGGQVIVELNSTGQQQHRSVWMGGEELMRDGMWVHENVVTGSERRTSTAGAVVASGGVELDALGNDVGMSDPYVGAQQDTDQPYPRFGDAVNQFGGCSVDGVPAPCGYVAGLLNSGSAALCPNGDCGARRVIENGRARIAPPPVYTSQGVGYYRWVESTGNPPSGHDHPADNDDVVYVDIDERGGYYQWVSDPAGIVFVGGLQRSTPQQPAPNPIDQGIAQARDALQQSALCRTLFGGTNPLTLLNTYASNNLITAATSYPVAQRRGGTRNENFRSTDVGAVTSYAAGSYTNANGVRISANPITINQNGFYFSGRNSAGVDVTTIRGAGFEGLSLGQVRGAVIVHELLHVVSRIPSDRNNPRHSQANSELVRRFCFTNSPVSTSPTLLPTLP